MPKKSPLPHAVAPQKPAGELTAREFKKLSREEQLLEVAKRNLEAYGTITPPPEVVYQSQDATCSRCGHTGPVMKDFGMRRSPNGRMYVSYPCKNCRGVKPYIPVRKSTKTEGK